MFPMGLNTDTIICDCLVFKDVLCSTESNSVHLLMFDVIRATLLANPCVPFGLPIDALHVPSALCAYVKLYNGGKKHKG